MLIMIQKQNFKRLFSFPRTFHGSNIASWCDKLIARQHFRHSYIVQKVFCFKFKLFSCIYSYSYLPASYKIIALVIFFFFFKATLKNLLLQFHFCIDYQEFIDGFFKKSIRGYFSRLYFFLSTVVLEIAANTNYIKTFLLN